MMLKLTSGADLFRYHEAIRETSLATLGPALLSLSDKIREKLGELGIHRTAEIILGSDGRLENPLFLRSLSPGELIVTIADLNGHDLHEIREMLGGDLNVDDVLGPESSRMFYHSDPGKVFPPRIFESRLMRTLETPPIERGLLFEEIRSVPHDVIKRFHTRLRDALKASRTGVSRIRGEDRTEIDFDAGVIHFDKSRFQNGVKTGALRVIQYGLMRYVIDRIRSGKDCQIDLTLPSNILRRIEVMQRAIAGFPLSNGETDDLRYIYAYFLHLHHMMQLENIEHGTTMFEFSTDDMGDIKKMLEELAKIIEKLRQ